MKKRAGGRVLGRLLARDREDLLLAAAGRGEPIYDPSFDPVTHEEID